MRKLRASRFGSTGSWGRLGSCGLGRGGMAGRNGLVCLLQRGEKVVVSLRISQRWIVLKNDSSCGELIGPWYAFTAVKRRRSKNVDVFSTQMLQIFKAVIAETSEKNAGIAC